MQQSFPLSTPCLRRYTGVNLSNRVAFCSNKRQRRLRGSAAERQGGGGRETANLLCGSLLCGEEPGTRRPIFSGPRVASMEPYRRGNVGPREEIPVGATGVSFVCSYSLKSVSLGWEHRYAEEDCIYAWNICTCLVDLLHATDEKPSACAARKAGGCLRF